MYDDNGQDDETDRRAIRTYRLSLNTLRQLAPDDIQRPMRLLLPEHQQKLLANGRSTAEASGADLGHAPIVKLFTPDANATWLLTELDPDEPDVAFGLCDLGIGHPELGPMLISDIEQIRGALKLPVERDLWFQPSPDKPISAYADEARERGRIIA